jgi:hypothetical protein
MEKFISKRHSMVELTALGKIIKFSLKNKEREKKLFETWYAMSDIPKYFDTKLSIITDKNVHLCYKIKEIEDCTYIDQAYENEKPEEVQIKEETVESLLDEYLPTESDLNTELKKILCKSFSVMPVPRTKKLLKFCATLIAEEIPLERTDCKVHDILVAMIEDPGEDVKEYAEQYKNYIKSKKAY